MAVAVIMIGKAVSGHAQGVDHGHAGRIKTDPDGLQGAENKTHGDRDRRFPTGQADRLAAQRQKLSDPAR